MTADLQPASTVVAPDDKSGSQVGRNGSLCTAGERHSRQSRPVVLPQNQELDTEQALYDYLSTVSGPRKNVTLGVSTTRFRNGKDLYGSYHFSRFYYPSAVRDTLQRFRMFNAPADMSGWTVYEFGCCIGALSLECVRRGAQVRAWEYSPDKVLGCRRLAQYLGLSSEQVSFYQQDLSLWLSNPEAAASEFADRFPAADLVICCSLNLYIDKLLRPDLYRFLARASRQLCWFESNSREPCDEIAQHLQSAGFEDISHAGKCNHRDVFIARAGGSSKAGEPAKTLSLLRGRALTWKQQSRLTEYIHTFLSSPDHSPCFDQNPDEILESLASPDRLSIALMPVDKHMSAGDDNRAVDAWYYKYVKEYSRCHKDFLNQLQRLLKAKLYTVKLLRHRREANIRDFLGILRRRAGKKSGAERRFFEHLNLNCSLFEQGVRVWDCHDYSSGRGYDEGAIVNRIVLSRNGGCVAFFLKGLGKNRQQKLVAHGNSGFENFEVTAFKAARLLGLNSVQCKRYLDEADPAMLGYTLLEEVQGRNTNNLFCILPDYQFAIHPAYARFRDRLIREFARIAAFSDLLRKGDRKIVQPVHTEYHANCLVNLKRLQSRSRHSAIWAIDYNHLFQSDNRGVLHDIKHGKCAEIGILCAFREFNASSASRSKLFARYRKAYLAQWARIRDRRQELELLIVQQHGKQSLEYEVFLHSLRADPRAQFQAQKATLLRVAGKSTRVAKSSREMPYQLLGQGFHGRVFKLSPHCCIKVFKDGRHAELERRAYEAARGCRFVAKLYEAGPNYIILEYLRGKPLKEHLKRTGRISAALTGQILSLFHELEQVGFTCTDFSIRHFILTEDSQLKVIDLKNAYTLASNVPYLLLGTLSRMGLLPDFLRQVAKADPARAAKWRRAVSQPPPPRVRIPVLTTRIGNGAITRLNIVKPELALNHHAR